MKKSVFNSNFAFIISNNKPSTIRMPIRAVKPSSVKALEDFAKGIRLKRVFAYAMLPIGIEFKGTLT